MPPAKGANEKCFSLFLRYLITAAQLTSVIIDPNTPKITANIVLTKFIRKAPLVRDIIHITYAVTACQRLAVPGIHKFPIARIYF